NAPKIFDVKYTREDTKLSIKFNTPVHKKAKKCTRVNIFMRGKVNILGASDVEKTYQICKFLNDLFVEHKDKLIVQQQIIAPKQIHLEDNIADAPCDL